MQKYNPNIYCSKNKCQHIRLNWRSLVVAFLRSERNMTSRISHLLECNLVFFIISSRFKHFILIYFMVLRKTLTQIRKKICYIILFTEAIYQSQKLNVYYGNTKPYS